MKTSEKLTEITKAYLTVQNDFLLIQKRTAGEKSKYAQYEDIIEKVKPKLTTAGIALFQPLTMSNGNKAITTRIQCGDEFMEDTVEITELEDMISKAGNKIVNKAQKDGMSLTYMKRYALGSFFAIGTGDKDLDSEDIAAVVAKKDLVDKSFDELLKDTDEELADLIRDGATSLGKNLNNKRKFFGQCKDIILPKSKEDLEAAKKMVGGYIL